MECGSLRLGLSVSCAAVSGPHTGPGCVEKDRECVMTEQLSSALLLHVLGLFGLSSQGDNI